MSRGPQLELDRSQPPPPGAVRPFCFPAFQRYQVDNGPTVLVAPVARTPLVLLELLAPAGAQSDPDPLPGVATLTAGLLDQGTAHRSAPEICAAIEELGGTLSCGANWDTAAAEVEIQAQDLDRGLALLAEVVTEPSFPAEELERARRQRLAELLRRRDQPSVQADLRLMREIYGQGSIYGRSILGDRDSVTAVQRDDVARFYNCRYPLSGATLIAVGELAPQRLLEAAAEAFAGSPEAAAPQTPEIPQPPPSASRVVIVDRPSASQTELRVGKVGIPRRHADHITLKVMNCLFGGKFTSRLNLNLREQHGYTYGVSSQFVARLGPGPFVISTAVATAVAGGATEQILAEVDRLRSEPPTAEELAVAQRYLVGTFPYLLQSLRGLTARLEELAVYGLDDRYFHRYADEVAAVEADDVLRVAREHLDPEQMVVAAVGPAAALAPQLETFGPVSVVSAM